MWTVTHDIPLSGCDGCGPQAQQDDTSRTVGAIPTYLLSKRKKAPVLGAFSFIVLADIRRLSL